MKINKKIEYALAGLYYLSYIESREHVQVRTIAAELNIPKRFLEQIFLKLREHGLLKSKRGSRGGYQLALKPTEIYLGHVMSALDELQKPAESEIRGLGTDFLLSQVDASIFNLLNGLSLDSFMTNELHQHLSSRNQQPAMYYI